MPDLVSFGRSWAYAPVLTLTGKGFTSKGYDRSQRCYQIENTGQKAVKANFSLRGSKDSPIINPAIFVKHWNANGAKILVNGKETKACRIGINHQLDGDDLVLYLPLKENTAVNISIVPQ